VRKLRLNPEELRIETFSTDDGRTRPGTVYGHYSYPMGCFPPPDSDPAIESCGYTCAGDSCWQSCNGLTCGCDPVGSSQCESAGPTLCLGDYSCIQRCVPIPP
jgi:hypothetical protein